MKRYALITDGLVKDVVLWDGKNQWTPPVDTILIQTDEADIGWTYEEPGSFVPPPNSSQPVPSTKQMAEQARYQRDQLIQSTEWEIQRHQDQKALFLSTTLSDEEFKQLQSYRQALREIPKQEGFPVQIIWPTRV